MIGAANSKREIAAIRGGRPPSDDIVDKWIKDRIDRAREAGRLMTDQQLSDHRAGRSFKVGDYAKFLGPTRDEKLNSGLVVERQQGQRGRIVAVENRGPDVLITFRPLVTDPLKANQNIVELIVRTGTAGFLGLERDDSHA